MASYRVPVIGCVMARMVVPYLAPAVTHIMIKVASCMAFRVADMTTVAALCKAPT
jgi:hypothetical protein